MTSFNSEKYISEAINSIINQTYKNWDLIIVDDGSTDSTLEIINTFSNSNDNIHVISQKNSGVSIARNNALRFIKNNINADYVYFLDSDDYILEQTFEIITNRLSKEKLNPDIILFNSYPYTKNELLVKSNFKKQQIIDKRETFDLLLSLGKYVSYDFEQYPGNKIFSYSLISSLSFPPNIQLGEDILFTFDAIEKSTTNLYIPDSFHRYRLRKTSLSHSKDLDRSLDIDRNLYLYNKYIDCINISDYFRVQLIKSLWEYLKENRDDLANRRKYVLPILRGIPTSNLDKKTQRRILFIKYLPILLLKHYINVKNHVGDSDFVNSFYD